MEVMTLVGSIDLMTLAIQKNSVQLASKHVVVRVIDYELINVFEAS